MVKNVISTGVKNVISTGVKNEKFDSELIFYKSVLGGFINTNYHMNFDNSNNESQNQLKDANYHFLVTKKKVDMTKNRDITQIKNLGRPTISNFIIDFKRASNKPDFEEVIETIVNGFDAIDVKKKRTLKGVSKKNKNETEIKNQIYNKSVKFLDEEFKESNYFFDNEMIDKVENYINDIIFPYNFLKEREAILNLSQPIVISILTKFAHILYCPHYDYLAVSSKNIITPESYRKNYKNKTTDKYILPKIYNIQDAAEEYDKIDQFYTEEPNMHTRNNLIYTFVNTLEKASGKKSTNKLCQDFTLITNTNYKNQEYYKIGTGLEYMLLMAISLSDKLKKNAIKRVLCYLIYFNCRTRFVDYDLKPILKKRISKKKSSKIELRKRIEKNIRRTGQKIKTRQDKPISKSFDIYDIDKFRDFLRNFDNMNTKKVEGNMLFWMCVNTALYFIRKRGVKILDDFNFDIFLKRLPSNISMLSNYCDFYIHNIYSTREVHDIFDYRLELNNTRRKDDFLKEYYRNQRYPLFFKDDFVGGYRLYDDTFKVHGKLKE